MMQISFSLASTRLAVLFVALVNWVCTALWVGIGLGGLGSSGARLFNWHPVLASCAMLVLFPLGFLSWRHITGTNHAQTKLIHATLLTAAFVVLNIAVGLAFFSHRQQKLANFYSLHSWIGMIAVGTMKGNVIGGLLSTFSSYVREIKVVAKLHRLSGVLACVLGFLAMLLGFAEEQGAVVKKSGRAFGAVTIAGGALGLLSLFVGIALTGVVLSETTSKFDVATRTGDEEIAKRAENEVSDFHA